MLLKLKHLLMKIKHRLFRENLYYISGAHTLPEPLSKEAETLLLQRLSAGDAEVREELIVHNLRLVVYIAKKFESTSVSLEDLISIGTIGLIKAVNTFRPEKKIKLATYASRCIENEILMFLRKISGHKSDISIDEPLNVDWDGNELLLSDVLGSEDQGLHEDLEYADEKKLLLKSVRLLPSRERQIMTLRFGLNGGRAYTQKEVAEKMGISQSYISRLEKRILSRLKKELERAV